VRISTNKTLGIGNHHTCLFTAGQQYYVSSFGAVGLFTTNHRQPLTEAGWIVAPGNFAAEIRIRSCNWERIMSLMEVYVLLMNCTIQTSWSGVRFPSMITCHKLSQLNVSDDLLPF
jgi:hypothetical protein